jgi:protein-arginine kinase activator protein McsA
MKSVICNNCNWVHFEVSAEYVRQWQIQWIIFWNESTPETRSNYGCPDKPPGPEEYLVCHRCNGNYRNFRDATNDEIERVYGSTINPILNRKEVI